MNKSKVFSSIIEHNNANSDDIIRRNLQKDIEELKEKYENLENMVYSYNYYLTEYQKKFGNELMRELERKLRSGTIELSIDNEAMNYLFKNFSLIKELEIQILENKTKNEELNFNIKRLELSNEELKSQNQQLFEDAQKYKDDNNNLANSLLNPSFNFSGPKGRVVDNDEINDIKELQLMLKERKKEVTRLLKENETLSDLNRKLKIENDEVTRFKADYAYKLKKHTEQSIAKDKETTDLKERLSKAETEAEYLKRQMTDIKQLIDELEQRKNQEIEMLTKDLKKLELKEVGYRTKENLLEKENNDLKAGGINLKQENVSTKVEIDHLRKLVAEAEFSAKSAREKEKISTESLKIAKKRAEELKIEKEKVLITQRVLEKQLKSLKDEFDKYLFDYQTQNEAFFESVKGKHFEQIEAKNEELSQLNTELMGEKMEKERYFSEYTILKKEYDKLLVAFRNENEKYMKRFEESESKAIKQKEQLSIQNGELQKDLETSEYNKAKLINEVQEIKYNEKRILQVLEQLRKSEDELKRNFFIEKANVDRLIKEKEEQEIKHKKERDDYERQLKRVTDLANIRVEVYQKTLKTEQESCLHIEEKALSLLEKHEQNTENAKNEFRSLAKDYEQGFSQLYKQNKELRDKINLSNNSIPFD